MTDNKISEVTNCFVVHVRKGYEDRASHIENMLNAHDIPFEFMLDGDIGDPIFNNAHELFKFGILSDREKSCALKHLLICNEILIRKLDGALILEDDICLLPMFDSVFDSSLQEMKKYFMATADAPILINYEDTRLRYVERSRRIKGRVLYPGDRDRMAGCYYINAEAAKVIFENYGKDKFSTLPIDLYHNHLRKLGKLRYLWSHPTIATQGSHTGLFSSSISPDKPKLSYYKWQLRRIWRRILYNLR